MKAKRLIKHDFDNMENIYADVHSDLGLYVDEEGKTAHLKISEYLQTLTDVPYLGHDNNIYPKYIVKEVEIK